MRRRGLTAAWGASGLAQRSGHAQRSGLVTLSVFAASLVTATVDAPALAQGPPDYDFEWRIIGSPGNRATIPSEVPSLPDLRVGAVDHDYRLARTEVTNAQWLEFLVAYRPFFTGPNPGSITVTGPWIFDDGHGGYVLTPGAERWPVEASWRMAARYCNWLTNTKARMAIAFERGAYDTSTFTQNTDGTLNDQSEHAPGALFWIPSRDEWVKGAHYDPNRYGPDAGGYWRYPNASNDPLISGLPDAGGQTNAGLNVPPILPLMDVGSYPNVQGPWGLLDISGGVEEWTEDWDDSGEHLRRRVLGSRYRQTDFLTPDRLEGAASAGYPAHSGTAGMRIASSIPPPGVLASFLIAIMFRQTRRGR